MLVDERDKFKFNWPLSRFRCTEPEAPDFQIDVEQHFQSAGLHRDTWQGVSEVMVLESSGVIVAAAAYTELSQGEGVFIEALGVDIDNQRQGLAKQLLGALVVQLRNEGYLFARWRVHVDNEAMLYISRQLGASEAAAGFLIEFQQVL